MRSAALVPEFAIDGRTTHGVPLLHLCFGCRPDFLHFLIDSGARVDTRSVHDQACLHALVHALPSVSTEIGATIDLLIGHGAPIDAQDQQGRTALHLAAQRGATAWCARLLSRGANAGLRDAQARLPAELVPTPQDEALRSRLVAGALTTQIERHLPTRPPPRMRL